MSLSIAKDHRLLAVLLVALSIWSLLLWQHFNGGVPGHYLLQRSDMPFVSNAWGGLLLPLLTWLVLVRISSRKRLVSERAVLVGFCSGLGYGGLLAATFVMGMKDITDLLPPALLLTALLLPVYRSECLLGVVFAMSYTFGAVLPTAFALVMGSLAFVIYNYLRPLPGYLYRRIAAGN